MASIDESAVFEHVFERGPVERLKSKAGYRHGPALDGGHNSPTRLVPRSCPVYKLHDYLAESERGVYKLTNPNYPPSFSPFPPPLLSLKRRCGPLFPSGDLVDVHCCWRKPLLHVDGRLQIG